MDWARGALSRVVVDLLYEIGGGPDGPGVTIDQLVRRVARQPPPGIRRSAIRRYAADSNHLRTRRLESAPLIREDGAGGIEILTDADGNPWFTETQAYRRFLAKTLQNGLRTGWVIRHDSRWRITSRDAGPSVPGLGPYHAKARAHLDNVDQSHAKLVTVKTRLEQVDQEMARAVLRHYLKVNRTRSVYDKRRIDYVRMTEALDNLTDPDLIRETVIELARRAVSP